MHWPYEVYCHGVHCASVRAENQKHGLEFVNFVIEFMNDDMSWWNFDLDYLRYVRKDFSEFEREHPRLFRRFADMITHLWFLFLYARWSFLERYFRYRGWVSEKHTGSWYILICIPDAIMVFGIFYWRLS